ncbi:retropepsin-like aspartic protease family protein [Ramlibacter albus]|uniref:Retroviral-like aspartic protease family protein n=1 Tax=Ramlibacter albus TaxID=2079448 RepID=A0A923MDC5_9BURK|nr:TIGR02281 family clan AA aspartic protease [Ramlibacter albus]MBC5767353.1 retroviral-like aspartic protease family protein [Ramlibacter albus]
MKAHLALAALLLCSGAGASSVALQGTLGTKALLIVDGTTPKLVGPGESHQGVKLISTSSDTAVVEIEGKRHTLRVGDAPASWGGGGGAARGNKIVLPVDRGGHFMAQGAINGKATKFMVDTGATSVGIGAPEADRLGINYKDGRVVQMNTANGTAPAYVIKLSSVRIGDVEVYDIEALVSQQPMPYVLLGNSFLNRFQMQRTNDQMVLERRY